MSTLAADPKVGRVVPNAPWPIVPLGELAANERNAITDGPFGSKLKTDHYTDEGPRVIRLKNIGDTEFVDARAHISEEHFATLQKHRVFPGDIVIAALGENPPRSCLVPEHLGPAIVKADCIRFKAGPRIIPKFLNYVLNAPDLRRHAKGIVYGVGRPRLNLEEIKSLPIPVPPLPEQRRIAAEIEKQFTRLDAGVAALRRTQANLKRYRAAVLKAACEGRLVTTEAELAKQQSSKRGFIPGKSTTPNFESGEMLVERILAERRRNSRSRGQRKEPVSLHTAALPPLPNGWTWATLDQISQEGRPIIYGIIKPGPHIADGVPYVRVTEMKDGRIDVPNLRRASQERAAKFARATLTSGDVLISKDGTIGRVAVGPPELAGGNITQHVMRAPIHAMMSRDFVVWAIRSDWCQHWLTGETRGVALRGVNVEDFRRLPIPIPPFNEQTRIVEEVERRLSVVEELETVVNTNLQRATRLREAILQNSFSNTASY